MPSELEFSANSDHGINDVGTKSNVMEQMSDETKLLRSLYEQFNARDMESVLAALDPDVMWANGMEGGHVHGRSGVRSYWTRQWAMLDPHVEPTGFSRGSEGEIIVQVHQVVRDLNGALLADRMVDHVFRIENGAVTRFDIREDSHDSEAVEGSIDVRD